MNDEVLYEPFMRKIASAGSLLPEDGLALRRLCRNLRTIPRRRDIVMAGNESGCVHILLSGIAARYSVLPDGSRRITGFVLPGDICDETGGRATALDHNVLALSECKVAQPSTADFEECVASSQRLTQAFWQAAVVENGIMRQWLASTGRRTAIEMIAHLLCELHLRLRLIGLAGDTKFTLPLTQEEIGDATGLTAVHVNRIMRALRESKLVERRGYELRLLNIPELRSLAGFNPRYLRLSREQEQP
ncbi:Crp/Fnr family transcriptional regulator [Sphingomonas sp. DT-51]